MHISRGKGVYVGYNESPTEDGKVDIAVTVLFPNKNGDDIPHPRDSIKFAIEELQGFLEDFE